MNKQEKKFLTYSVLAVFLALTLLLGIINAINFTMASEDADIVTSMIANRADKPGQPAQSNDGQFIDPAQPNDGQFIDPAQPNDGQFIDPTKPNGDGTQIPNGQQGGTSNQPGNPNGQAGFSQQNGEPNGQQDFNMNGFGPMGPTSPETASSVRFFTYAFDNSSNGFMINYNISAITEEEAADWARDLINSKLKTSGGNISMDGGGSSVGGSGNGFKDGGGNFKDITGWTNGTYRYRIYQRGGLTYVTVIDQGRELLSCYRILVISGIGILLGTLLSFVILRLIAKRLFAPLAEADHKQKQFIKQAEKEFKVPLTVISANTELIERQNGPSDNTRSIHRQVRQMQGLVKELGRFQAPPAEMAAVDLSALLTEEVQRKKDRFAARNLKCDIEIQPGIELRADAREMGSLLDELTDNAVRFAQSFVRFHLSQSGDRIWLKVENDAELTDGVYNEAFDRFTTLSNAGDECTGLGLSYVKSAVQALDGRAKASVKDGVFCLEISL